MVLVFCIGIKGASTESHTVFSTKTVLMGPGSEVKKSKSLLKGLLEKTKAKKLGFRTKFSKNFDMDFRLKKRNTGTKYSPSKTIGGQRGLKSKSENTPYLGFRVRF